MKKKKLPQEPNTAYSTAATFSLATLMPDGQAPDCRINNAFHAFSIAEQLRKDNLGRQAKLLRIYKAVKRFPPTGYSKLAAKKLPWQSDVNWGQLAFTVNNQRSSYFDVITERKECAEIKTKFGNEKERLVYSENISYAFDYAIREWPGYLMLKEQNLNEMLVYGAGIGGWQSNAGWIPEHFPYLDTLFPADTKIDLSNLEEFARIRRFTPFQLWKIIRNEKEAKEMGWNVPGVIDAIRCCESLKGQGRTRQEIARMLAGNELNWGSFINQEIVCFELYWREFDGKISKGIVLQDYGPLLTIAKSELNNSTIKQEDLIRDHGFLQKKVGMFDSWDDIFFFDLDSASDVMFTEIKSLAEECFVGARQYDMTMNALIDAVRLNMMLLLSGTSPEATKKLKQMEWLPISVLPDGATFAQNRFQLPIQEAMVVMQSYMGDLYRGIGQYRINAPTNRGGQRTKGEAELDAAEGAKLTGTQLKRYRESETFFFRKLYKRFVESTQSDDGWEYVKKFWDILEERGVPRDAALFRNIASIKSNYINGAGSPSMKMIVAEKIVGYSGMTAANEGQEAAIVDAIAALAGRDNAGRYRKLSKKKLTEVSRVIGNENAGMTDVLVNPANFPVLPEDFHIEHVVGHRADMLFNLQYANDLLKTGQAEPEQIANVLRALVFKGAHIMAHVGYIQKDPSKKDFLKEFMRSMEEIQKGQDQLALAYKGLAKEQPVKKSKDDIEIEKAAALAAIQVDTAKKMADIETGKRAIAHDQRTQQRETQAIQQQAIQEAKGELELSELERKTKLQEQAEQKTTIEE